MKKNVKTTQIHSLAITLMFTAILTLGGCDNKEKVLDIETPGGEIEIQRDRDSGAVDVEVEKKE